MEMANVPKRVKLYTLGDDHQWIDKGTGHIISTISSSNQYFLKVYSEDDESVMLDTAIMSDTTFEKQQETLILWCDKNDNDYALSFQEKDGCEDIWNIICSARGVERENNIDKAAIVQDSDDEAPIELSSLFALPPVDCNHLKKINDIIRKFETRTQMEKLSDILLREDYVNRLLDVFRLCEAQNNFEALGHLCEIFKHIVALNNTSLFEEMFKKERIFDVVGCFEYDKCAGAIKRHRHFLSQNVQYREVMPVLNCALLDKIHQTYRVQYIQDVILPSINALDESVYLSAFLYINKVSIVNMIQEDEIFLIEVFGLLANNTTETAKRRDVLLFLKELFSFAQYLQQSSRETFYKKLIDLKIINALELCIQAETNELKLAVTDIFVFLIEFSPSSIRKYMIEQSEISPDGSTLMKFFVNGITSDPDCDQSSCVFLILLKLLLNPDSMELTAVKSDKTDFLNYFYKNEMDTIIEPFLTISEEGTDKKSLGVLLDFLEFCVEHHSYHIRNIILHKDLLKHILTLMKSQYKILVLSALRFIRKIISLKDEFYNRYIISGDLLAPVIEAFLNNQGRYNMLDSAILELFEFIRTEELKSLCSYIMEHFGDVLSDVKYVQTFKFLRHTYERNCIRNKEKALPLYQDSPKIGFNLSCELNYKVKEDSKENACVIDANIYEKDCANCNEKEMSKSVSETVNKVNCSLSPVHSPKLQSIIVDHSPFFRKFGCMKRPSLMSSDSVTKSIIRKRLVDYDYDEEDEENEVNGDASFGMRKRLRSN